MIDAEPWCQVSIDDEERGPTPLKLTLPAGAHRVHLRNAEFGIERSATIVVEPGKSVRRRFAFPEANREKP